MMIAESGIPHAEILFGIILYGVIVAAIFVLTVVWYIKMKPIHAKIKEMEHQ